MALPDGAGQLYAVATRVAVLDANGVPAAGSNTLTTTTPMKITLTPVMETGDDLVTKDAKGDIAVMYKLGDMIKYYTCAIELATPDNYLEQAFAGGVLLSDNAAALGLPAGLTATGQTNLGTIAAGTYGYRATQINQYGESLAEAEVQVTTTGSTSSVCLSAVVPAAGATAVRYYGRAPGGEQFIKQMPVVSSLPTTTSSSGTGAGPFNLAVSGGIPAPIPAGYQFQITGDTNSPKITFTVSSEVGTGAISIPVTASQSITTTIAGGLIIPCFLDTGSITPSGALPSADTTAGPGQTGYQAPALGVVGNANGVSLEIWTKAVLNGRAAPGYPYNRWAIPLVTNLHQEARDFTNAVLQNPFTGEAFQNPNWGTGPFGDWDYDSTKVFQRARRGATDLPATGLLPVSATV